MRIMEVITLSELGGAQSVVANLSNELSQEDELIVVAGKKDGKLWDILSPRIKKVELKHLVRRISPFHDFLTYLSLVRLYWKYKPDVVHLHSSKAGLLGRLAFPSHKIVYTVHGFDSIRVAYRKLLPFEKLMQHFCHSIVAVSQYDYQHLQEEGIRKNLEMIHNGIPEPKIGNGIKLDIPNKFEKVVLCIARIAKPKRLDIFLDTAKLLPQYAFVWIGNLQECPSTSENVFFLGNIPHASNYCMAADLFMLASDFEGLPMVVIEAMSYGKPVVASHVGGIQEIVRNGHNGYVVSNTPQEFANKIEAILSNQQLTKSLGDHSYKIYKEELTAQEMTRKYKNIYTKIYNTTHKTAL